MTHTLFRRMLVLWLASATPVLAAAACTVDTNVGAIPGDSTDSDGSSFGDATRDQATLDETNDPADANSHDDSSNVVDGPSVVDAGCGVTYDQVGGWVDLQVVTEVAPPNLGGDILAGTYTLTGFAAYLGAPQGTAQVRETLVVAGSPSVGTFTLLSEARATSGQYSSYGPTATTFTYHADPNTGFAMPTENCPGAATPVTWPYTATATTLAFQSRQAVRTYTKVP